MPKYEGITVVVDLDGPGGNAFAVLGAVNRELRRNRVPNHECDQFITDATSADYPYLLFVCEEWVTMLYV